MPLDLQHSQENLPLPPRVMGRGPREPQEGGFTMIESLLAVVMVGLLIVAIGPVLALSAATRLQARRVELATQAARGYIDGVRSGTIKAPIVEAGVSTTNQDDYIKRVNSVPVPVTGSLNCAVRSATSPPASDNTNLTLEGYCSTPAPTTRDALYCIDGNSDGVCTSNQFRDFVVQAMGVQRQANPAITVNDDRAKQGYVLGIRVYRADAFVNGSPLQKTAQDGASVKDKTYSGGFGNPKRPLVEMLTEIAVPGQTNYNNICNRVGGC